MFFAALAAILAVSLVFRFAWLDHIAGINGDEAYFPVQIQRWMAGLPFTLRAPSGLFVDPLTLVSEWALLLVFQPSVWILRLPVAVGSIAGIALAFVFHARVHRCRTEALLVAALCAALPLSLAYSRCGWVPSFMPLAATLVWYPAQLVAEGRGSRGNSLLLVAGALFCLSVHMTSGVFLLATALALVWVRRAEVSIRIATWTGVRGSPWLLPGAVLVLGLASAGAFVVFASAANLSLARVGDAVSRTCDHLLDLPGSAGYVGLVGPFLSGARAYRYFAGIESTRALDVESWALVLVLALAVVRLCRSTSAADRFMGVFWAVVPVLLLGSRGLLAIDFIGQERYVLWMLIAAPSALVRGLDFSPRRWAFAGRAAAILGLCTLLSIQFWQHYFVPLRATSAMTKGLLHPTFWTGEEEPKAVAARMISAAAHTEEDGARTRVLAEDYWVQYPLQFLLGSRWTVQLQMQQAVLVSPSAWFAVGFSGSTWSANLRERLNAARVPFEEVEIFDGAGPRILTLFRVRARR